MLDDYKNRLNYLSDQVDYLTETKKKSFIKINFKYTYIYYVGIPIILIILLIISKPWFIMTEVKDNKTFFIEKKINYNKVFLYSLLIVLISFIIYFVNNLKKS